MLCFTKAFGTVFLGTARHHLHLAPKEDGFGKLIPMYVVVLLIVAIGLFPQFFIQAFSRPTALFNKTLVEFFPNGKLPITDTLSMIGICAAGFFVIDGVNIFYQEAN